MKLLFLDIDGVLNSSDWARRRTVKANPHGSPAELAEFLIDPKAIARVNDVLDRTGALVVLSSAWRLGNSERWMEAKEMLYSAGLKPKTIVGRTPDLTIKLGSIHIAPDRGDEIGSYLKSMRECGRAIEAYAAVDDTSMRGDSVKGRLVLTDMSYGLVDEHVERLVDLLGEV